MYTRLYKPITPIILLKMFVKLLDVILLICIAKIIVLMS
jgi:hypothetical protein